jgi:hypothetical protein
MDEYTSLREDSSAVDHLGENKLGALELNIGVHITRNRSALAVIERFLRGGRHVSYEWSESRELSG